MEQWGSGRADDLARLVADAMPAEGLTADELLACCWEDPGIVVAAPEGDGAVAAVVRGSTGWIKLLAVRPGARRRGLGRALLTAAEEWATGEGAGAMRWGDCAPFYLWPGIDVRASAALCLAEVAGYEHEGANLNLSCATKFRMPPPEGVVVRRVLDEDDAAAVHALCGTHWPWWEDELRRGIEHGCCLGAFADDGSPVGFGCHSVNRAAWVGPMATDPGRQHGGVGSALLGEVCKDLMVAGHADAEIAWVGPVSFYVRSAGAAVSRVFRTAVKPLAGAP